MDLESLIKALVPAADECAQKAATLRLAYPTATPIELAERAVSQARKLLAATGGAAGAVSNPLAMVPLAAGEMVIVLRQEARLAGIVAALLEPDVLKDEDAFTADVLGILFPNAVSQALREVAVRAGQATSRTLIRKYVSKDVLKAVIRFAARYLGVKITQRAIITKALPLVGAAIGASWNWIEVQRLGRRAILYYCGQDIAPVESEGPMDVSASAS